MTGPRPSDAWSWFVLATMIAVTLALMFGGKAFGQPGDPRPSANTVPIMGIDTAGRFVLVGDIANHALRVNVVAGGGSPNVNVVNSVLPTGASTDVSVQAIEQAMRETQNFFGSTFPVGGQAVAAVDPSGYTASLSVSNLGYLNVNIASGGGAGGTSSNFAAAMPTAGTAAGFRDSGGFMATASITNNNALLVESVIPSTTNVAVKPGDAANNAIRVNVVAGSGGGPSGTIGTAFPTTVAPAGFRDGAGNVASGVVDNASNLFVIASQSSSAWTVNATGTITAHQGDTWTVACSNCSGASTTNYGSTFPASGLPIGVKDGAGRFASMVVDNASNLFVIASQSSSAWTVTATGTITAHQGDTWTVNCSNCSGASTTNFGATFPAGGLALGVKDGSGHFASMVVDNASNLFVIASQSSSAWTVIATGTVNAHQVDGPWTATGTVTAHQGDTWTVGTNTWLGSTAPTVGQKTMANSLPVVIASDQTPVAATGTITAHQGDTWTVILGTGSNTIGALTANQSVNLAQVGGTTTVNGGSSGLLGVGGPTATGSQASANPLRMGAVARPTNKPTVADGNVVDLTTSSSGDLYVRADTSAATGTIAPARVQIMGGWGKSAVATAVTICDQFASVSLINGGNTQVITGVAGQQIHICSIVLITASATAVGIFEGGGTLCNTNRLGLIGSHSTHNGVNLATTGGFTLGTGMGEVITTQQAGVNICLGNSTAAVVSGGIKWTSY